MRCLTLAEELQYHGVQIRFISRGLPQYLREMLKIKGMELAPLESGSHPYPAGDDLAHSHWLNTSQEQDAQATNQALSGHEWDWLVVDHYALDARWQVALRRSVGRIMVIDDIADRYHDCDVLLDQNLYADMRERYAKKVPAQCRQFLGPRYALLRDEFRESRKQVKQRNGPVKRILVFFGGMDIDNYTGRAIEVLAGMDGRAWHVDVVIGKQHPCREQIEKSCVSHGYHCHVQTKRISELMAHADLAIGAGGTAMWERCCLGLPTLSFCVAYNQDQQIADAAEQGLVYSLSGDDLTNSLQRHIGAILANEPLRKLISKTAMQKVDGLGVNRIAAALLGNNIGIRIVNESDSPKLFEWRNHQTIRAVSKNTEIIEWTDHKSWFVKVQADKTRAFLIGEINNEPVGVVRFDHSGETALVSIYLIPDSGFNGQGHNLLLRAEEWLKTHHTHIKSIKAEVLDGNTTSQRLFAGADYQLKSMHYLKEL